MKEIVSVSSNSKRDSHARLPLVCPCLVPDGGYGAAFPASTAVLKEAQSPSQHLDEVVYRTVQPRDWPSDPLNPRTGFPDPTQTGIYG